MPLSGIVLILAVLSISDTGVDGNSITKEAERLAEIGAWNEAITEYERYVFFHPDSPSVSVIRAIADCYGKQGDFKRGAKTLDRALSLSLTDSLRDEIRIESAAFQIGAGEYQAAQLELIRIATFASSPELRRRAYRYLCLVYCMVMDWAELNKLVNESVECEGTHRLMIDSLLKANEARHRVSPVAAQWMSTVLPGLGQVYARDFRNGCNALAISFATGYLLVQSVMKGYFQEALLTDITLFWRYYSGNRWRAREAAERFNQQRDLELQKKILTLLAGK